MSRTILVMGGTGGLGGAIVRRLAGEWENVAFTYHRRREAAEQLGSEVATRCTAYPIAMDITEAVAIESAVDAVRSKFGQLDAFVFACGVDIMQPYVSNITREQWDLSLRTELVGFIEAIRHVLPLLRAAGGGPIVNIGSFGTKWFPPGDALSAVPKAATEMMCRAIAKEEGRYGIRANTVAPGIIAAGIGKSLMGTIFNDEIWEQQRKRTPLRRFGTADDIANAVAYLCSGNASFVTGQTLIVDGGLSL